MESFILDPFALVTDGTLAPVALASWGQFVIEAELAQLGIAENVGKLHEPWDRGYYLWKYGKQTAPRPRGAVERPPIMARLLQTARTERELERLDALHLRTERDIAELEAYIAATTAELEAQLAREIAEIAANAGLIEQLEANKIAAREALLLAVERQRRQQNNFAAIQAAIREYF